MSERRQKAARKGKKKEGENDDLGPELPDIPKDTLSRETLEANRTDYRREIRAERARGLYWLAAITAVTVWCTGILFKDNALQP